MSDEPRKTQPPDGADPTVAASNTDPEKLQVTATFRSGGTKPSSFVQSAIDSQIVTTQGEIKSYVVEKEVARGGMGVILKVRDDNLRRDLAMKVILEQADPGSESAAQVDSDAIARFMREAEITGQLDHPGVVPVHEIGTDQLGRKYFTMRLVKGNNLHHIFGLAGEPDSSWTQTRLLDVLIKVCDTLAFAHSKGIIHRDLKPGNIMVGPFGETYVMDWGLAKVLHQDEPSEPDAEAGGTLSTRLLENANSDHPSYVRFGSETIVGSVLGTPAYMPPEQAAGQIGQLDARSDVYSLGTMLYHLLADAPPYGDMRPPFTTQRVIEEVITGPPTPLTKHNSQCPPELVAICEKAMRRAKRDRYQNVSEMADDLRAFLEQRVVRAYRTGPWAELKKWINRNRGLTVSSLAAIVFAIAGMVGVIGVQKAKNNELSIANSDAKTAKEKAILERNNALKQQRRAEGAYLARRSAEVLHTNPGLAVLIAREAYDRYDDLTTRNAVHAARAACSETHTLLGHRADVWQAKFSPDERRVALASDDGSASIWEVETGRRIALLIGHADRIRAIDWSQDGNKVITGSFDRTAAVWNSLTGERLLQLHGHQASIRQVSMSPNGKWAAATSIRECILWNAKTGQLVKRIPRPAIAVRFSPDSRFLAVGHRNDGGLELHDLKSNQHRVIRHENGKVAHLVFSEDSRRLLSSDRFGGGTAAHVWDVQSGSQLAVLPGHASGITASDMSHDGQTVVTGDKDGTLRIWQVSTGEATRRLAVEGPLHDIDLSADAGFVVAAVGNIGYAWQLAGEAPPRLLGGHKRAIHRIQATEDGGAVATASADGTARLWSPHQAGNVPLLASPDGLRRVPVVSPAADRVLSYSPKSKLALLWELPRGKLLKSLTHESPVRRSAFGSRSQRFVTITAKGKMRAWDAENGKLLHAFAEPAALAGPVLDRTSEQVAVPDVKAGRIDYWSLKTGKKLASRKIPVGRRIRTVGTVKNLTRNIHQWIVTKESGDHCLVNLSGDVVRQHELGRGRHWLGPNSILVSSENGGNMKVANILNGQREVELAGSTFRPLNAFFASDGTHVAVTASGNRSAYVWELPSGKGPVELSGHGSSDISVWFSQDATKWVTLCRGVATLWHNGEQQERLESAVTSPANGLAFLPGTQSFALSHSGGEITFWSLQGELQAIVSSGPRPVIRPAGKRLLTLTRDSHMRLWDISAEALSATRVPRKFTTQELLSIRDAFDNETLGERFVEAIDQEQIDALSRIADRLRDGGTTGGVLLVRNLVDDLKRDLMMLGDSTIFSATALRVESFLATLPSPHADILLSLAELHAAGGASGRAHRLLEPVMLLPTAREKHRAALQRFRDNLSVADHSFSSLDALFATETVPPKEDIARLLDGLSRSHQLYLRAKLALAKGETQKAIRHLETCAGMDPKSFRPAALLAEAWLKLERPKDAERILRQTLMTAGCPYRVWHRWLQVCFRHLQLSPADILATLPDSPNAKTASGRFARRECRVLLETLASGTRLRVNSGGESFSADDGGLWTADAFYTDGSRFNEGSGLAHRSFHPIVNTETDELYQTERYFAPRGDSVRQGYRIPVPNGRWSVRLHFAEIYFPKAGQRMFDVALEDETVLSAYDTCRAGPHTAETLDFEASVKDGSLDLYFDARIELPKISGFEVWRR